MKLLILVLSLFVTQIHCLKDLFYEYGYNSVCIQYEFNITHGFADPDGVYREVFLINNQSPGPLIKANEGDWIKVKVNNYLPVALTFHFHGLLQKGTPWADGPAGVVQWPIISGDSYTHLFQLNDQYGAFWYHAHYREYSGDGIYGPMYIKPAANRPRPYAVITNNTDELSEFMELEKEPTTLMAADWFKWTQDANIARTFTKGIDPLCIQSLLVNGKQRLTCPSNETFNKVHLRRWREKNSTSPVPIVRFPPVNMDSIGCYANPTTNGFKFLRNDQRLKYGQRFDDESLQAPGFSKPCKETRSEREIIYTMRKRYLYLNVYNVGGAFGKSFSIDDHDLVVIAIDGTFVHPLIAQRLIIPIGTRYTVLVKVDLEERAARGSDTSEPFAIRFAVTSGNQIKEGLSFLVYDYPLNLTDPIDGVKYDDIQAYNDPQNGEQFQDMGGLSLSPHYKSVNPLITRPFDPTLRPPLGPADHSVRLFLNRTGTIEFSMFADGDLAPRGLELEAPLLHQHQLNHNVSFSHINGVIDPGIKLGQTVDLIVDAAPDIKHPIHLHGHSVYAISSSVLQTFPYDCIVEAVADSYQGLNFDHPPLVDIFEVPNGGHLVLRFVADNPGFWLIHCHIGIHMASGMMGVLVEAKDDIPEMPEFLLYQAHANYDLMNSKAISSLSDVLQEEYNDTKW
ncbi:hypothetical protein BABINDRAFT_141426 [Babjeviella inositovora NRRL Y-12698]|uniref:Multicopper oxidase n=1 Tax=Babjeviella inositovora NRRL Y-12698 TaxID=984486 RepID=A0A1E3QQI4_9ASCO|nr:uncharacterized protein BABINDRAFT_141426 [Babjeviella inositovora NRRL Y-12698]ODQ79332.1 hypothetical protein BABINDRAFT_141426 [Babjeviella inositovora NRRL Y-12698]